MYLNWFTPIGVLIIVISFISIVLGIVMLVVKRGQKSGAVKTPRLKMGFSGVVAVVLVIVMMSVNTGSASTYAAITASNIQQQQSSETPSNPSTQIATETSMQSSAYISAMTSELGPTPTLTLIPTATQTPVPTRTLVPTPTPVPVAPSVPNPRNPGNGSTINSGTTEFPTLSWDSVSSPSGSEIEYYVEITGPINVYSGWISGTSFSMASGCENGSYSWRVMAKDTGTGLKSEYSEPVTFIKTSPQPSIPTQLSPANGTTFSNSTGGWIPLTWSPVSSTSGEQVYYAVCIGCTSPSGTKTAVTSSWLTSTSWTPTFASIPGYTYDWRVIAMDGGTRAQSGWTDQWFFTNVAS